MRRKVGQRQSINVRRTSKGREINKKDQEGIIRWRKRTRTEKNDKIKVGDIRSVNVREISEIINVLIIFGHQNLMASVEEKGKKPGHSDLRNQYTLLLRCSYEKEKRENL